ncbi:hypothetical protein GWK47_022411 [Chionoecetes opilio]|uniref:Uncharacterized protein n=1 Tax=Chionoecetes opilio TaxID=41210 RepID=A0A8J5CFJ2_CHIOP|nr:hypothetical protein GWK47_022411 [Chionoecetes opilio]
MLWHLGKFFVFDSYVRTENDTLEGKSVHTGRARCQQKTCLSKGKLATYTYTTRSKMHSAMLHCVPTAFDGGSRGAAQGQGGRAPRQEGWPPSPCLEESFSRKDIGTPEVRGKTCTSLLAPEFSAPSRGTLGREIARSPPPPSRTSSVCCMTPATSPQRAHKLDGAQQGLHWHDVPLDRQDLRRQHGTLACKESR